MTDEVLGGLRGSSTYPRAVSWRVVGNPEFKASAEPHQPHQEWSVVRSSSIKTLQLFLGGFQFFVGALQLLVGRRYFLVRRLEFFVAGLLFFDHRL
jgi:hypothetical protein